MNALINWLKEHNVHDQKLAIARFLLALGTLLTLLSNDISIVANHTYTALPHYSPVHTGSATGIMKQTDLFMEMTPVMAKIVIIFILLLVMSGYVPQLTCLLHVWAVYSIKNYFLVASSGIQGAMVLSVLLLPVCLSDPRLNQWQKKKVFTPSKRNMIANVAVFAIQLQAAFIYMDAGVSKLFIKEWQEGTAAYYYTSQYPMGAPGWLRTINENLTLSPFVAVITWSIIALELLVATCLFAPPRLKTKVFKIALLFHALIIFNFGFISLFFIIMSFLVLYLDDEDNAVKILERIQDRWKAKTQSIPVN